MPVDERETSQDIDRIATEWVARMDRARRELHARNALGAARELGELWPARAQWSAGERAA